MRKIAVFDIPDDALIASDASMDCLVDGEIVTLRSRLQDTLDDDKGDTPHDT